MEQSITCINCPVGCRMTVVLSDTGGFESVSGNTCPRGAAYARQECTLPKRTITAVVPVDGSRMPLSVKTSVPIPKELIQDVMHELGRIRIHTPVHAGQIIIHNVLESDADIVATRTLV